jgi:UDP-N-acetylglucosamine 2-epimerase (non-hydrolysing)
VQIFSGVDEILLSGGKSGRVPEYWDGHAAERIITILDDWIK